MHVVSRSLQLVLMSLCGPICSATAITYAAWSLLGRGRFFYVSEVVPTSHWSILSTSIEPAKKQTWFRLNLVCFAPMQDGATLLAQYMTKGIYSLHPSLYPTYLLYRWSFENYRIRFRTLAMKDKHCIFGGDRWYSLPIKLDSRNAPFTCNSNKTQIGAPRRCQQNTEIYKPKYIVHSNMMLHHRGILSTLRQCHTQWKEP